MNVTWSRSLTLRLTLLFALAAALVLFLLGLLIGNLVEQHFVQQDMEALSGKMELTQHILKRDSKTQDNDALRRQLDDALTGHHGLVVAVFGPLRQALYGNEKLVFPRRCSIGQPSTIPSAPSSGLLPMGSHGGAFLPP